MISKFRTEVLKSEAARWVLVGLLSVGVIGVVLTTAPQADNPKAPAEKEKTAPQNPPQPGEVNPGSVEATKSLELKPTNGKEATVGDRLTPIGIQKGPAKTTTRPMSVVGKSPVTQSRAASRTSPKSSSEQNLVNREVYVYKTIGRRDPFASLLEGEFETTVGHPLLDVSSMKLVGVVWGKSDKFALIEDGRGHGHILRVGDPVINGYVVGLTEDGILIRQSSYGESQTVTIQLQRKESASDAR